MFVTVIDNRGIVVQYPVSKKTQDQYCVKHLYRNHDILVLEFGNRLKFMDFSAQPLNH